MTTRETLIKQFSKLLGDDFNYYYDTDQLQNQIISESECQYIQFKFKPSAKISRSDTQKLFESKLAELKSRYMCYDICGGRVEYFGYILTIKLNSIDQLEKSISNAKIEHEQKIKRMEEQLEILKKNVNL